MATTMICKFWVDENGKLGLLMHGHLSNNVLGPQYYKEDFKLQGHHGTYSILKSQANMFWYIVGGKPYGSSTIETDDEGYYDL